MFIGKDILIYMAIAGAAIMAGMAILAARDRSVARGRRETLDSEMDQGEETEKFGVETEGRGKIVTKK